MQLKKEEQAKQFEEQMAMRQQQSELLKSFTDVHQSMQSQMQKQAELSATTDATKQSDNDDDDADDAKHEKELDRDCKS